MPGRAARVRIPRRLLLPREAHSRSHRDLARDAVHGAFTKPNADRILSKVAEEKGIKVVPNFATSAVEAAAKRIRTFDGDNSNVATSKAGSVAHFEAETVIENLLREIDGKPALQTFDGHANCFVETGHHKAMLLDFNYDIEPLEGDFPLPHAGPFSLLEESHRPPGRVAAGGGRADGREEG